MDDNTDLLLKYAKQNNDFLRAIYSLAKQNNELLKYIKQEIDKEFSLENLIKVESIIFVANIVANIFSNILYNDLLEDKSKYNNKQK